ncbi:MAG: molecular chaperone DnaJ [Candidatus Nanopelagicaceae bacterium]|nr:molecular chaperone DnaJ [Candidatus Nanopelagicaceae bacterium]
MAAKDLYEKDYYAILGVDKKADAATIKKTYRALARELHPDKTKGDKKLEDRFKEVSEAYEILSDDKKRAEYDQAREMFKSGAFRGGGQQFSGDFSDLFGNGGDIFSSLFGGRRGPRKGQDIQTEVSISFRDALFGKEVDLRLSGQGNAPHTITVRIPAGVSDGAKVRVKGRGAPGEAGPGDLYVLVNVIPHPVFTRKGENLHITVPVSFTEAALGADISVPTIEGDEVKVRINPGTQNGKTLRIKGRGVKKGVNAGDLMATIEVQVPQRVDGKAKKALEDFAEATKNEDLRSEFIQRAKA